MHGHAGAQLLARLRLHTQLRHQCMRRSEIQQRRVGRYAVAQSHAQCGDHAVGGRLHRVLRGTAADLLLRLQRRSGIGQGLACRRDLRLGGQTVRRQLLGPLQLAARQVQGGLRLLVSVAGGRVRMDRQQGLAALDRFARR